MLPKPSSGTARKKIIFLLGALLAVNAAVAHIVTAQITSVSRDYQVKDEQVTLEEATPASDDAGSDEDLAAPSITIYTVKSGDTISTIATKFGVSQNTVLWANDMTTKSVLSVGKALVILPINGVQYTVKSGDTISGIAAKFDADAEEILYFNDLDDPKAIQPGVELIIPDAEPIQQTITKKSTPAPKATISQPVTKKTTPAPVSAFSETDDHDHNTESKESEKKEDENKSDTSSGRYGMFIPPAPGSILTQGYHAVNAVDFGGPVGTPILAAAEGTVIVSKMGCATGSPRNNCNGGFGNFIVI